MIHSTPAVQNKTFILSYDYVSDILEKRGPYREEHLGLAKDFIAQNKIVAGGPYAPPTGACFLFTVDSIADVQEFIEKDPYVSAGLVPNYDVKEWSVLVGKV